VRRRGEGGGMVRYAVMDEEERGVCVGWCAERGGERVVCGWCGVL